MNNDTIRRLYKIGIIVAAALFVVMLVDHFANDGDLIGLFSTLFALVALWLIVMLFLRPTEEAEPEAQGDVLEDYPGDVHEVVDLEGIGPSYAEKLHKAGVYHTQELIFADDKTVQDAVGVPPKTVRNWKAMSQLIKVNGIGPQYAEALVRGGVDGIEAFKEGDVAQMTDTANAYLDRLESPVVGQKISEKRMKKWQTAARRMKKKPIDMDKIKVRDLESKEARKDAAASA